MEQATYQRGQVSTKVRYSPVQLVLDVPDGELLPAWAADPHKKQEVSVVFLDANGGQPIETLHLSGAYCIRYHEQFVHGDAQSGSYQCTLTLSDPTGWTIEPGGPAAAFVAPAARSHGIGGGAVAAAANALSIVGAMGTGATSTEPSEPITVSRDFVGELPIEHSDLGRMALDERIKTNNWSRNNVAVFEYEDENGQLQHKVQPGIETTRAHSERLALVGLKKEGVNFDKIKRIYSELEPCELGGGGFNGEGCKVMLAALTPHAKITYSYPYKGRHTDTRPAREATLVKREADFLKYQTPTPS